MKQFAIILTLASLSLMGCGDVYKTVQEYEIIKQGTDLFTDYIDARNADWKLSGREGNPGCYLYQEYKFDEITDRVLESGAVLVYLVDGDGRDNILPYVLPFDNGREIVMQNIRFDVERGILTLIIEWQDFKCYQQNDYRFKVCILSPGVN